MVSVNIKHDNSYSFRSMGSALEPVRTMSENTINKDFVGAYASKLLSGLQEGNVTLKRVAPKNEFSRKQTVPVLDIQEKDGQARTFAIIVDPGTYVDEDSYHFLELYPNGDIKTDIEVYLKSSTIDYLEYDNNPENEEPILEGKVHSSTVAQKFAQIINALHQKKLL